MLNDFAINSRLEINFNFFTKEVIMRISQTISVTLILLMLAASAFAQGQGAPAQGGQGAPAQGGAPQGGQGQGGQAQGGSSTDVKLDVTQFFSAVDTNKDNKISKQEWVAAGLDEGIFKFLDQKSEGSFSKETLSNMGHPQALDADKDGKMTLEEVKTFTQSLPKPNTGSDASAAGAAKK